MTLWLPKVAPAPESVHVLEVNAGLLVLPVAMGDDPANDDEYGEPIVPST